MPPVKPSLQHWSPKHLRPRTSTLHTPGALGSLVGGTGSTLTLPGPATPTSPKGWPPDPLRTRFLPSAVPALLNLRAQPTPKAPPAPAQHGHPGSVLTKAVLGPLKIGVIRQDPTLPTSKEHRMYLPILEMDSNPHLSPGALQPLLWPPPHPPSLPRPLRRPRPSAGPALRPWPSSHLLLPTAWGLSLCC